MKLMPLEHIPSDYEWVDSPIYSYYALVGNISKKVHVVFAASSGKDAKEMRMYYENMMGDSGYTLMKVEGDI